MHETQFVQLEVSQWLKTFHHGGPLQGQKATVVQQLQGDVLALGLHLDLLGEHQGDVLLPPARVAHHVQVVIRLGDNQVVHDAPVGQGEDGEGALVRCQAVHVGHCQTLHEANAVLAMHLTVSRVEYHSE